MRKVIAILALTLNSVFCYTQCLIGYNQNWSYLPTLDKKTIENIQKLKPQILRYPGGTLAHSWDWQNGVITKRPAKVKHPITDIKKLVESTGADFIFVLDIVNKTLSDQITMLEAIEMTGVSIKYIELGNELYAKDKGYQEQFPSGKDYAVRVAEWAPKLRAKFPKVKIAALLLARKIAPQNDRQYLWNSLVVTHSFDYVDAYTYHIYIPEHENAQTVKANFVEICNHAKTKDKELWITEYGNQNNESSNGYLTQLSALADFLESFPHVTMALSHQIIGSHKNKLTQDGLNITPEGELFIARRANSK